MGKGYDRFRKELIRANESSKKLILIVCGSWTKVLGGIKHSKMSGLSVMRKLLTLWIKYDLVPICCKDRNEMSKLIYEFYCAVGRQAVKNEEGR